MKISHKVIALISTLAFINIISAPVLHAETPAAQPENIKLGMSSDFSNVVKDAGLGLKLGIDTYFNKINAEGGVDGRKLELIALDDAYDPLRTGENDRELIDKDGVIALMDNTATAPATVTIPIAVEKKTLFYAPATGADVVYPPPFNYYIINFRASYRDETAAMIKGLIQAGIKPEEIAFVVQNDTYGDSVYNSSIKALKEAGYANAESLPYGRYNRATSNVEVALAKLIEEAKKPPKAIIMGGVWAANTKFINLAIKEYPDALFLPVSGFVVPDQLDKKANGRVITTWVVPSPFESDLPAVKEYREDLKKYSGNAKPSYFSLEGYLSAKLLVMGLEKASKVNKLTRAGIIEAIESLGNVDIGINAPINLSKTDHQSLTTVWPTILKDGKFIPINNWSDIKPLIKK